jgi:hypothetical protein
MLRSENSAFAQKKESSRDRQSNAGLPALRRVHPFGTTPPASKALASARETGWDLRVCEQLTLNPTNVGESRRTEEHEVTESTDCAPSKSTTLHESAPNLKTN